MKKKTISDTPFGMALDLKNQAIEAAKFLVRHQSAMLGEDAFNAIKSSVKMTVSSAFADIYSKVVENGVWESGFTLLDLSDLDDSVPTIFTLDDITVDGKYITEHMPKSLQTAWINLTPILGNKGTRNAYNSFLQIKDSPRLAALVSRGIMCMSYNDSDGWLNATLNEVILDAYSYVLTLPIKMMFNIDVEQDKLLRTFLAAYYAQLLQSDSEPKEIPSLLYRCRWLGSPREIEERLEPTLEYRKQLAKEAKLQDTNELTLDIVCSLIAKYGPERMSSFNSKNFVRYMSRSSMDRNATIMALYYPPYFVFMLLAAMHGMKNPIFSNLLKYTDNKRKLIKFEESLLSSNFLLGSIKR